MSKTSASGRRLPLWRTIIFSLAGLPVSAAITAMLIYLPPHLTSELGVPLAAVGGAWAAVRLLDVFIDPALGMAMDATRTPFGRYRPWLAAAAPICALALWRLFFAPHGIGEPYLIGWLAVFYLAFSMVSLSHPAWAATLARGYDERSRIYGVIAAVSIAAIVLVLIIPVTTGLMGHDKLAIPAIGWFLVVACPAGIALALTATPERINPNHRRDPLKLREVMVVIRKPDLLRLYGAAFAMTLGPGWMSSIYIFFAKDYMRFTQGQASQLLLAYILAGLAGAPAAAKLATRIGKHRTLMAAALIYSAGLLLVLLPPKGLVIASAPIMFWCGFAGAAFDMVIRSMLADVADEVRLEEGKERMSLIYSVYTLAGKVAAALAIGLTFPLLQWLGYQPRLGTGNSPDAIHGLGLTFISGPICFVILGAVCMIGWRLTSERHAHIRMALEARDAQAALGIEGELLAEADASRQAGAA